MKKQDSKQVKIIKFIFTIIFLLAIFFVPAGTMAWTEAWVFIGFYFLYVGLGVAWLKKHDPDLLKERMKDKKDAKPWDRFLIFTYVIFMICMIILAGLDAVRFRWSDIPLFIKILGFAGFLPATAIIFWAMRENSYLSDVVRIQDDCENQTEEAGDQRPELCAQGTPDRARQFGGHTESVGRSNTVMSRRSVTLQECREVA